MTTVRLLTREGHLITEADIRPMAPMPDAIVWGSRTFFSRPDNVYREGMVVTVSADQPSDRPSQAATDR